MIIDLLDNRNLYFSEGSNLFKAIQFIADRAASGLSDGRYEFDNKEMYAMMHTYHTGPSTEKKPESHRKYIDVQYVVSGKEMVEWSPSTILTADGSYAEERDVLFYNNLPGAASFIFDSGMFAVFFPEDAHKPCCMLDHPLLVRKLVVKVKV